MRYCNAGRHRNGHSFASEPRDSEIPQGEFQAAVFGVVVVSDGEGDVDRIARQHRRLLEALGHVPAQGVEGDFRS